MIRTYYILCFCAWEGDHDATAKILLNAFDTINKNVVYLHFFLLLYFVPLLNVLVVILKNVVGSFRWEGME